MNKDIPWKIEIKYAWLPKWVEPSRGLKLLWLCYYEEVQEEGWYEDEVDPGPHGLPYPVSRFGWHVIERKKFK